MKRLTLFAALWLLALPASAFAASGSGVVLTVNGKHHTLEVVDSAHVVHAFQYRGRLPKLHAGSVISFQRSGKTIRGVRTTSSGSRSVAFYGRVVRSSKHGLVLRLADGKRVSFSSKQVRRHRTGSAQSQKRHAHFALVTPALSGLTINIQGLQPGVTVLVTETADSAGNVTITLTFPPASVLSDEQQASGVVTDSGDNVFVLQTDDGSELRLHMALGTLARLGLQPCDTADVAYHQDAGMLIADRVTPTGTSTSGDCANSQNEQDAVGTITNVSGDGVTIATQDQGTLSFTVDSSDISDGFQIGDVVDVTYVDTGSGLDASDVEYVSQDSTGTVTAVSDGSLTITDDNSGQPVTFTADPSAGVFDGIVIGDQVDVTSHASSAGLIADSVDDSGPAQ